MRSTADEGAGPMGLAAKVTLLTAGLKFARRHPAVAAFIGGTLALFWIAQANGRRRRTLEPQRH